MMKKVKVSAEKKTKKVKKAKPSFVGKGLKIVDEDSFANDFKPVSDSDDEDAEELPQIADVVDERPLEVQVLESFNAGKWKRLDDDLEKDKGTTSSRAIDSPPQRRKDSDDISPPRRRDRTDDISPPRRKRQDSGDFSPPRRRNRRDSNDFSPPRRKNSSSPRRREMRNSDRDSPPRRRERRPADDVSPPRRKERKRSISASPPRRRKRSPDMSPPRRRDRNHSDESPPRQRRRRDSDDLSPPHRGKGRTNDDDLRRRGREQRNSDTSPPRRRDARPSNDLSPPRKRDKRPSDDLSPPRKKDRRPSDDFSPPRRRDRSRSPRMRNPEARRRDRIQIQPEIIDDSEDSRPKTTLDGKKAGLQKAGALRDEMLEFRKREKEMLEALPDEVSGRNAKAVKRDRRTEADIEKEVEKERKEAERKAQYDKWGKGLKQVEEREQNVRSAMHEMAKPLARYKDDEDLDDHLRSQDREGDPMLEYLMAKRRKAKGQPEKPKYSGPPPPPNRFNIPPGFRWDGVDRSNGYEKEWFSRINAKKALQEEAYKWSVEDL